MIRPSGRRISPAARAVAGVGVAAALSMTTVSVANADPAADAADADAVDTSPLPTDADGLLARLGEISRQAQQTSDEVGENTRALDDLRERLDNANRSSEFYSGEAQRAREAVEAKRAPVTELSQSMYRGAVVDPVSAVAGSTNPQDAIDRSAFASALNTDRTTTLADFQDGLKNVADLESRALRAKASADFQLKQVDARQKELDGRSAQLDGMKEQISVAVDGLSPDQKERWVDRNGPIDVDVDQFLGRVTGGAGAGAGAPSSDVGGAVGAALSKLGAPYAWGAAGPDAFDCSGLMYWAYQQVGKSIPRTSQAQTAGGTSVSRDELQPGDIVGFYPGVTHVGLYIGDGQVVHASDYGIPVQVVSVDSMPFAGAARY